MEMIRRSEFIYDNVGNEPFDVLLKKPGGLESFYLSILFNQKNKVIDSTGGQQKFLHLLNCDEEPNFFAWFLAQTPVRQHTAMKFRLHTIAII